MAEQTVTFRDVPGQPAIRQDGRLTGICAVFVGVGRFRIRVYLKFEGPARVGRSFGAMYVVYEEYIPDYTSKEQQLRMQQVALDVVAIRYGREIHLTRPLTQRNPK